MEEQNEDVSMKEESSNDNKTTSRFGWDTGAWVKFVEDASSIPIENARVIYDEFLSVFPTAVKYWKVYIERETSSKNYSEAEALFNKCLIKVPHVSLWQCYLDYCRTTTKNQENGSQILKQAYEYAINNVKYDKESTPIWKDYIHFLQELPTHTLEEENVCATDIRETFERALETPLANAESIWTDYLAWLNNQNKVFAQNAASKMASKRYQKHSNCRVIYRERKTISENLPQYNLAVPPGEGIDDIEQELVKTWKKIIQYEKKNPQQRLSPIQLREQVEYTYKQAILDLLHFPEIWYDYAKYFSDDSMHDEAIKVYESAISYLPDNILLHFAYADYLEHLDRPKDAEKVYQKLLKTKNETLVWIQYMFFEQRVSGMKRARKVFLKARKSSSITHHLYIASAMMEFYHNHDPEQARKIFLHAFNTEYGKETEFIVHYIKFLWTLNEVQNTRAMFESVLASLPLEKTKMIWNLYLEFEYECGDAKTVANLENRRAEAYPTEDQNGILALVNRHKYQNLWPCNLPTLDSFEYGTEKEQVIEDVASKKQEEFASKFPRPDTSIMLPYREQMASLTPSSLGVLTLPLNSEQEMEIISNDVDNNYSNLPDVLVDYMASLDKNQNLGIPKDIDALITLIQNADLPPLPDASVALGKRRGDFSGDENPTKKQKTGSSTTDVFRKRQAKKKR